jgi:hypothetical protein
MSDIQGTPGVYWEECMHEIPVKLLPTRHILSVWTDGML